MKISRLCKAVTLVLLLCVFLGGCEDTSLLSQVPKTAAIQVAEAETETDSEAKTDIDTEIASQINTESFLSKNPSRFAYNRLSDAEKIWYHDMEELVGSMTEKGSLSKEGLEKGLDETDIDKIFQCMLNDHPELFYVDGYTYTKYMLGDEILSIDFAGNYNMEEDCVKKRQLEIEEEVIRLIQGISGKESDYAKVKYVYETIIQNTDYDLQAADNQNIYSVFINHRSVCQGYAKATQYLLNRLGVECTLVQGSVDTGEGHAWNLVLVDGSFYYLDTTWGDVSYSMDNAQISMQGYPEINYDYLCITTQDLLRTHMLNTLIPMPECVDTKDNYYVREGAFFTENNKEQMQQLFLRAKQQGKTDVTIKCASQACFQEMKTAMIDEFGIFDYLDASTGQVSYSHNDKGISMTFWVTNE